jgi:flagellar hook assembly protein FlgD
VRGKAGYKFGYVKLNIYDMLGREVKTLLAKDMEAGSYEYNVDGSNLSSGAYFYRIEVVGGKDETVFAETKRMILVK